MCIWRLGMTSPEVPTFMITIHATLSDILSDRAAVDQPSVSSRSVDKCMRTEALSGSLEQADVAQLRSIVSE